jgi:hypothetical protein
VRCLAALALAGSLLTLFLVREHDRSQPPEAEPPGIQRPHDLRHLIAPLARP